MYHYRSGKDFNPRSHERSDGHKVYTTDVVIISIHAPTRGATKEIKAAEQMDVISIHAPTRGATIPLSNHSHGIIISIHAPTRGATSREEKNTV